jgi:uncharacterized protein
MKIAVIGASGNAGARITAELARRGHAVTAIARNPEKIARFANVIPTRGDASDEADLTRLLRGHDAAISSIHFLASDPAKLIGAAKASAVGHYLVVGGAGSLEVAPVSGWSRRRRSRPSTGRRPRRARLSSTGSRRRRN